MIRGLLHTMRRFVYLIRYFDNWPAIALLTLTGRSSSRIALRNGLKILAPENNTLVHMAREVFIDYVYTPPGLEIEADDVVVDIGANVGVFALYAARKTRKTVYCFEPFPENMTFLQANIVNNEARNIHATRCAISDANGTARLYLSEISGGHLLFDHNIMGHLREFVEVPTKTLEQIMRDHAISQIDFLKLDCEGAEGQILCSTSSSCLRRVRRIAMEFHDNVSRLQHEQILELLQRQGFECGLKWDGVSPFGYLYAIRS